MKFEDFQTPTPHSFKLLQNHQFSHKKLPPRKKRILDHTKGNSSRTKLRELVENRDHKCDYIKRRRRRRRGGMGRSASLGRDLSTQNYRFQAIEITQKTSL